MKSLTQYILAAGLLLLTFVALLGGLAVSNITGLGNAARRVSDDILIERQLLARYQRSLDVAVINASLYARTAQPPAMRAARAALADARALVLDIATVQRRTGTATASGNLVERRALLVTEADDLFGRLDTAIRTGNQTETELALQLLDVVARNADELATTSDKLLEGSATMAIADVDRAYRWAVASTIGIFLLLGVMVIGWLAFVRRRIVQPLRQLLLAVLAAGMGRLDQPVKVTSRHEVGQLQAGFNAMLESLLIQQHEVEERTSELEAANQRQTALLETVNALAAPVLPILDGVLVLPVVGHVDDRRALQLTEALLAAVYQQRAHTVILDLTGLADIDAAMVDRLLRAIGATELLGARVHVAGIAPAFARVMARHPQAGRLSSYQTLGDAVAAVGKQRAAPVFQNGHRNEIN